MQNQAALFVGEQLEEIQVARLDVHRKRQTGFWTYKVVVHLILLLTESVVPTFDSVRTVCIFSANLYRTVVPCSRQLETW